MEEYNSFYKKYEGLGLRWAELFIVFLGSSGCK